MQDRGGDERGRGPAALIRGLTSGPEGGRAVGRSKGARVK